MLSDDNVVGVILSSFAVCTYVMVFIKLSNKHYAVDCLFVHHVYVQLYVCFYVCVNNVIISLFFGILQTIQSAVHTIFVLLCEYCTVLCILVRINVLSPISMNLTWNVIVCIWL